MTRNTEHLLPRILIGAMALIMAAATIPSYFNPTMNPGLTELTGPALMLGNTAGAFLGRQLTLIFIALIGAISGQRNLVMMGGFALMFMNGHDAIFMGLMGGPAVPAIAGLAFAIIAAAAIFLVWRKPAHA
jgi:hypothetical protein